MIGISGLGGNGKTALARHIAERWCNRADAAGVLWVSARREMLVGAQIQAVQSESLTFAGFVDQLIVQTGLAEAANRSLADKCVALGVLFQEKNF